MHNPCAIAYDTMALLVGISVGSFVAGKALKTSSAVEIGGNYVLTSCATRERL
jgi:hypothetical protein